MGLSIVIGLVLVLVLLVIGINAIQQNKERVEAEKRAEVAKHKAIVDETDDILSAAEHLPVSNRMLVILHNRIIAALRQSNAISPSNEARRRIQELENANKSLNIEEPLNPEHFRLPDHEKQIIVLIQGIKKLRIILRSEANKGRIDNQLHAIEDAQLTRYQLMVNIETLIRRAHVSIKAKMQGSARQYLEKAAAALKARKNPDAYVEAKKQEVKNLLDEINSEQKSNQQADIKRRAEAERNELDEIFAPKKKW